MAVDESNGYTFRVAHSQQAFMQNELVDHNKFGRLANDRGLGLGMGGSLLETLERLDQAGALRPIVFEQGSHRVFRDERAFEPWSEYAVEEDGWERISALYSPWQLLYAKEAIEGGRVPVRIEWILAEQEHLSETWRLALEHTAERWREIDDRWRSVILLLVRIQNRYYPSVRGTLTTSQFNAPFDLTTGEPADYQAMSRSFDPEQALRDLVIDHEHVKSTHQRIAMTAYHDDPLGRWGVLSRMNTLASAASSPAAASVLPRRIRFAHPSRNSSCLLWSAEDAHGELRIFAEVVEIDALES